MATSTVSVLSTLSRLNSAESEDIEIETQISQLSELDSVEETHEQVEEELPSPFHRRTSSRRELLQKSQLNIDEIHCVLTEDDEKELEVLDQNHQIESTDLLKDAEMKIDDQPTT